MITVPERFKCRSSSLGKLMKSPQSKADKEAGVLSESAKGVVKEYVRDAFGLLKPEIGSKPIRKGNLCELDAIEFLGSYDFCKYERYAGPRLFNDYLTGTPDILFEKSVKDIKCPWSWDTFPMFADDLPKKVKDAGYDWQCVAYMDLAAKPDAEVCFVMMPCPEALVYGDEAAALVDSVVNAPDWMRINRYQLDYEQSKVDEAYERVEQAQPYYKELIAECADRAKVKFRFEGVAA